MSKSIGGYRTADGRIRSLDALRGTAILVVIFHHTAWKFSATVNDPLAHWMLSVGWAGVDLFFAISGYLIASILVRDSSALALKDFFVKRLFRIVPLYLVALVTFTLASLVFGVDKDVIHRIWMNAMFLTAWAIPFVGENGVPYTITWSVSVEEFAYVLFGALAMLGPASFRQALIWVAMGALLLRICIVFSGGFEPISLYYFAPARVDAIAIGGIAALFTSGSEHGNTRMQRLASWALFLSIISILAFFHRENIWVASVGYSFASISAAWLVRCAASSSGGGFMPLSGVLAYVGRLSYFLYLFHPFAIGVLNVIVSKELASRLGVWGLAFLSVALTVIPASLSWRWFEQPLIALGRRLGSRLVERARGNPRVGAADTA